jgi:hypothetical protein
MPNSMLVPGVVQFLVLKGIEPYVLVSTFVFGCLNLQCDTKKNFWLSCSQKIVEPEANKNGHLSEN